MSVRTAWLGLRLGGGVVAALVLGGPGEAFARDRAGSAADEAGERQIRAVVVLVVLTDLRPGAAEVPAALVDEVEAALRDGYRVEVRRVPARPLPRSAYRAPRKRYRADDLLVYLRAQIPAELPVGTRVLGLTAADISTTKGEHRDWGVFGLGELGGTAAVVSTHRLRRKARDAAQVTWRVTNTAVHELGHVLGLDHCDEPRCVMLDAEGAIDNTDESSGAPGPQCALELDRAAPLRPASVVLGARAGQ